MSLPSRLSARLSAQQQRQRRPLQPGCCTGCGRLPKGRCAPLEPHPLIKATRDSESEAEGVPVCQRCRYIYDAGTFTQANGVEDFCRWCGDGGTLYPCDGYKDASSCGSEDKGQQGQQQKQEQGGRKRRKCQYVFCQKCILRNFGNDELRHAIHSGSGGFSLWRCYLCDPSKVSALLAYIRGEVQEEEKQEALGGTPEDMDVDVGGASAAEDTTAAAEDTSAAAEDFIAAAEDTSAAAEDTSAATEDTVVAAEDTTAAAEDTSAAEAEDTTAAAAAMAGEDADDEAIREDDSNEGEGEGDAEADAEDEEKRQEQQEEGEGEEVPMAAMAAMAVGETPPQQQHQEQLGGGGQEGGEREEVAYRSSKGGKGKGKRKLGEDMAVDSGSGGGGSSCDGSSSGGGGGGGNGSGSGSGSDNGNGNGNDDILDDSNYIAGAEEEEEGAAAAAAAAQAGGPGSRRSNSSALLQKLKRGTAGKFVGSNPTHYADGGLVEIANSPTLAAAEWRESSLAGCFNWTHVTPEGVFPVRRYIDDISGGLETVGVSCVNEVDEERLPRFTYTDRYVEGPAVAVAAAALAARKENENPLDVSACCDCDDGCLDASKCKCAIATNGFAYTNGRFSVRGKPLVRECGNGCACNSEICVNRVVGRGIKLQLQVFRSGPGKGWGLRTVNTIPAGSFVADYLGELLPDSDADTRPHDDEYLFNLDANAREAALRGLESRDLRRTYEELICLTKAQLAAPAAAQSRMVRDPETGNEVDIFALYGALHDKEMTGGKQRFLCVDAKWFGNVARFINHSCEPNMEKQAVLVDSHDGTRHRLALFATEDILPGTELTYDYGYTAGVVTGKAMRCLCGSQHCGGGLL